MMARYKVIAAAPLAIAVLLLITGIFGCPSKKDTTLSGKLELPPGARIEGVSVAAMQNGKEVAEAPVDAETGKYLITLPGPGTYDLRLKTPRGNLEFAAAIDAIEGLEARAEPFPAPVDLFEEPPGPPPPDTGSPHTVFPVPLPEPGQPPAADIKPPVTDEEHTGPVTATLKGVVHPDQAMVKVLSDGDVIAEVKAAGGVFEVRAVPPGLYDIEYAAPGYSTVYQENIPVAPEGALQNLNGFLLYMSPLDGVNWDLGTVTATGLGKPNPNMPTPQATLMACQAAKTIAYRNLLDTILNVQVDPGKSIASISDGGDFRSLLNGFVQGARVVAETKNSDGTCEVTLEAPLKGKTSVTSFVQQKLSR